MSDAIKVDDGFVRLVDVMGDDSAIVQAARVSYGKGTTTKRRDELLIRYLMENRHTSPFEMVEFKFHIKCPIFVARQWLRHRTASVNEYSMRYSEAMGDHWIPERDRIRYQDTKNHQASSGEVHRDAGYFMRSISKMTDDAKSIYHSMIDDGVSREVARTLLPVNQYTQFYWKIDLHNLLHFINLRADSHAQEEIQKAAVALAWYVREHTPVAFEAWHDTVWRSVPVPAGTDDPQTYILSRARPPLTNRMNEVTFFSLDDEE